MKNFNRATFALSILIALLCSGCNVEGGHVAEHDKNKILDCKDTRDGEVFSFNSNTAKDVRAGILGTPTTFTVTTLDGKEKVLSSDMEYLKCEKRT